MYLIRSALTHMGLPLSIIDDERAHRTELPDYLDIAVSKYLLTLPIVNLVLIDAADEVHVRGFLDERCKNEVSVHFKHPV